MRSRSGNVFNDYADRLAYRGTFQIICPSHIRWRDVLPEINRLHDTAAAMTLHSLELSIDTIYEQIRETHQKIVATVAPLLPKASPRKPYHDMTCQRSVDRREYAREAGDDASVIALTRGLARECERARKRSLRNLVSDKDWVGVARLKSFNRSRIE